MPFLHRRNPFRFDGLDFCLLAWHLKRGQAELQIIGAFAFGFKGALVPLDGLDAEGRVISLGQLLSQVVDVLSELDGFEQDGLLFQFDLPHLPLVAAHERQF